MKILISTLLLGIVVYLNFGGLNAAESEASSSVPVSKRGGAKPNGGRPKGGARGGFRLKDTNRHPIVIKGPPNMSLTHMGQNIEVWLDQTDTRILQVKYPKNFHPTGRDYGTKSFLVRLHTLKDGLKIVEYVKANGELMGLRAPILTTANVMEPSSTQCFIVYFGHYFRVRLNPETKKAVGISIASENEHEPVKGQRAEEIDMAGIKFVVFRGPDGNVSGAALSRKSPSPPPPPSSSNLQ